MKDQADSVKVWEQLQLLRGGPVQLQLLVGIFPEADHCQFQIEVTSAGDGDLLLLESRPHGSWTDVQKHLSTWLARVTEIVNSYDDPFG